MSNWHHFIKFLKTFNFSFKKKVGPRISKAKKKRTERKTQKLNFVFSFCLMEVMMTIMIKLKAFSLGAVAPLKRTRT